VIPTNAPPPVITNAPPPVATNTPPKPQRPETLYGGGDGLYKPYEWDDDGKITAKSKLWLLPAPIKAAQVHRAGEFRPDGTLVRWFSWPGSDVPYPANNRTVDGTALAPAPPSSYYHNGRLKMRQAKATTAGNIFRALDATGGVLAALTIIDPERRQEGRSKK
jgi:hypothetical protein